MYKLSENKNYKGSTVYPKGTNVNVRKLDKNNNPDMTAAGVVFQASTPAAFGVATGRQILPSPATDSKGLKIEGWMEVKNALGFTGFVRYDLMTRVKPVSQISTGDGKALIENIIARDSGTFHTLLYTQELIDRLKKKGVNVTAHEKSQAEILKRYAARRKKIEDSKMLKLQQFIKPGFEWLKKPLTVSGVGVIQFGWVGALVIAGIAVGVTAFVLYDFFHSDAQASEIDLNAAKSLSALLEKATPEEKTKVLAEITKHAEKQYEAGYTEAKADSVLPNVTAGVKSFTNLGMVALAAFVLPKLF